MTSSCLNCLSDAIDDVVALVTTLPVYDSSLAGKMKFSHTMQICSCIQYTILLGKIMIEISFRLY